MKNDLTLKPDDVDRGYVLFNRDFQRYVFPWTIPDESERIEYAWNRDEPE